MRTVSFQGTQLTSGQRRQLAFQQQARAAFLNPVLEQQVEQGMAALERHLASGKPYEDPNKYHVESTDKGTPWVGDCFVF
jgi:hypothetical protein